MPYCGIIQTVFSAADQCQASADFIFRKKTKIAGQKDREKLERERELWKKKKKEQKVGPTCIYTYIPKRKCMRMCVNGSLQLEVVLKNLAGVEVYVFLYGIEVYIRFLERNMRYVYFFLYGGGMTCKEAAPKEGERENSKSTESSERGRFCRYLLLTFY